MRTSIRRFAEAMESKLEENDDKGGWGCMPPKTLLLMAIVELRELTDAIIENKSGEEIISECADVANFMMMIADNAGRLGDRE